MKFATFSIATPFGPVERVGVVVGEGRLLDINAAQRALLSERADLSRVRALADAIAPPDLVRLLANGTLGRDAVTEAISTFGAADAAMRDPFGAPLVHAIGEVSLLSPIPRPPSLRDCSAFEQHVVATSGPKGPNKAWYEFPTYYKGNTATIQGTGADVVRPTYTEQLDYELEFAIVIGRSGRDISETHAVDHIAGYTVFNDVSARDVQFREMRMFLGPAKGKDMDTGNVLGPFLVTPDEFNPAEDHQMTARVDGETWSRGSTGSIYHSVSRIVSHISQFETLHVGDVIGSGTVGGGCGLELGRYPEMGATVELEIEGIGAIRNRFVAAASFV
jgi:2-keto-4-pentenoate hydratase/2-oxohepta-3-ene-1,7-dioic acid hydratase in catechol pathway